ncbi:hypothetical protein Tco_1552843, partial [Tanacetum coccineum]
KSRCKGSLGKKTSEALVEEVERCEESEPEPVNKKTSSNKRVKKTVTIFSKDNIIPNPDIALELEEQEAADTMKALKESRKSNRRQPGTRGSNEGTGSKAGVLDESTVVSATSSEGTGVKPRVPSEEKDITKEKVILKRGDDQDSGHDNDDNDNVKKDDKDDDTDDEGDTHISDTHDADDKDDETKSDEDEIYKYKIHVQTHEDERMSDAEVVGSEKGDKEVSDAAKADAKKTSEVKDDAKKTELPPLSSSLSVSLDFGDQFLKTSSNTSFIGTVKDSTDAEINSLMDIKIQYELSVLTLIPETPTAINVTTSPPPSISTILPVHLQQQSTTPILTPPITTDAPTITTAVHESDALNVVQLRVVNLEKDVFELKKIDISVEAFAALKKYV